MLTIPDQAVNDFIAEHCGGIWKVKSVLKKETLMAPSLIFDMDGTLFHIGGSCVILAGIPGEVIKHIK